MKPWSVGILLYDYVDALDYSGPYEVFSLSVYDARQVRGLIMNRLKPEEKPFVVHTLSQYGTPITAHNGLRVHPAFRLGDHPKLDLLVIPGGPLAAMKHCLNNTEVLQWIRDQHREGVRLASVCTGALLLAEAGLLAGKRATTNALALDYLEQNYPDVEVMRGVRFVDSGDVMTSAGVAAGIDMALYIVGKRLGEQAARTTAATMEYPYSP